MGWLSGWSKRQAITITGGADGSQVDFQLKLTIAYDSDMLSDFSDLRFTDADGTTLIDAWLEDKTDGVSADVWVEFPTTPANGVEQTYYMYYGKADALDDWDISATAYKLGDDFDTLDTGNPILDQAAWGDTVLVNGTYYMFYADDSGSSANIRRTTTSDFKSYTPDPGDIAISGADAPAILKDPDGITPVQYDGKYWMAYCSGTTSGIKIAYATSITGSWTDIGVKLDLGGTGAWDESGVYTPSFVKDGDTYYIFYQGIASSGSWKMGYATSSTPDGTWTKYASNPVLSPTADTWDSDDIQDPIIRKFDAVYYLFYSGTTTMGSDYKNGYATSNSITGTWTKYTSNPILSGDTDKWDVWDTYANIFKIGDTFYQIYDGHNGVVFAKKGLATTDNLTGAWTKYAGKWGVGGSPSVSSGELLINAVDEYIISSDTFQYRALKARVKFPSTPISFHYFGFQHDAIGDPANEEMFFAYNTPDLKAWSGNSSSSENTPIYDSSYFGSYHTYEILWKSGEAKFYIDDTLKDTDTTDVCDSSQPVGFYDYEDAGDLYVDWVFVRKYTANPPTYEFGSEENAPVGASHGLHLVAPYTLSSSSDAGETGTIVYDSDYMYVCVATNTWKRVSISTW